MLRDPSLLGRAALGFAGQWSVLGRVDDARLALLEEALDALGDEDDPLRARLLARLALAAGDLSPRDHARLRADYERRLAETL